MEGAQGGGAHLRAGADSSDAPISRNPDKGKRDEWSEDGVVCLLEVYESKWQLRNRAKLKGSDWEDIARLVSARCSGTKAFKTANQCKNKIESMKKRYRVESIAMNDPGSCSSWQFYARMEDLLKGTTNSAVQPKSDHHIDLHTSPKAETEVEADGHMGDSFHDDGSNTVPVNVDANGDNDTCKKKENRVTDGNLGRPDSKEADTEDTIGELGKLSKRRKLEGNVVAESMRLLAQSILKIEQARLEMYKDSERMRAEVEIKRGEMELKRTEIVAKTQLQIAELFVKRIPRRTTKINQSSLRPELGKDTLTAESG